MSIYDKTQTENGLVCLKPLKFDMTDVESGFKLESSGYSKKGGNGKYVQKKLEIEKNHQILAYI